MSQVAVVGAGYVGLTTAACFAHLGHQVACADVVAEKIERLARGEVTLRENGLDELVREGLEAGRLRFVLGPAAAVAGCEFIYLCVPTPQRPDGSADLSYIEAAAADIGSRLEREAVVVTKSTVPVGSTRVVERALRRDDVAVVSNPEFLREGSAVHDFLHPDRIVIGAEDKAVAIKVASLFTQMQAPVVVTDPASAETIKYASNAFLATKVSFINAIANVCEAVGADVREVVLGMGYDRRIGFECLKPGPGWGGSCLPKDAQALVHLAEQAGYDFSLLRGVIAVNDEQHRRVVEKIQRLAGGGLEGVTVAVWGLTFKARTDDLRNSPSLNVIQLLQKRGARVQAYDPAVPSWPGGNNSAGTSAGDDLAIDHLDGERFDLRTDPYGACEGAAVLAVLTEWEEFRWVDLDKVAAALSRPCIVDARNLLDPAVLSRRGFTCEGIGR